MRVSKCILFLFLITKLFSNPLLTEARDYPQITVSTEILCDIELILNGGFSPLTGFLDEENYHSVLEYMRLSNGALWPVPIVFSLQKEKALEMTKIGHLTFVDEQNYPIAIFDITQSYSPDVEKECLALYGSIDDNHPNIQKIVSRKNDLYLGGNLRKISLPHHFDFASDRLTPEQTKSYFKEHEWTTIVGFQTRNPLHCSHLALIERCMEKAGVNAKLLLHPVVGTTQPGDINHYTRVKCYRKLLENYQSDKILLSLLPLSMKMAGPREALWHALIRKNYGCTHFIIGRDHAGPSCKKKNGELFFTPYEAQELVEKYQEEIGIKILAAEEIVYDKELEKYIPLSDVTNPLNICNISGTQLRNMLLQNDEIPSWFSYPEIINVLKKEYQNSKGTCIYFVGLSGSGKSTLCTALKEYLNSIQDKPVIIVDGDVIRKYLSNKLGFSREDRAINVQRIGYVASLIVEAGGICLCANIAPYQEDRLLNRQLISSRGTYIEVFVDTPIEVCEERDVKGLYNAARNGNLQNFTGVTDPFEPPTNPDIIINSSYDIDATLKTLIQEINSKKPDLFFTCPTPVPGK